MSWVWTQEGIIWPLERFKETILLGMVMKLSNAVSQSRASATDQRQEIGLKICSFSEALAEIGTGKPCVATGCGSATS